MPAKLVAISLQNEKDFFKNKITYLQLGVVVPTCNFSIWEVEAGELGVQDLSGLHSKFIRTYLTAQKSF